jgi:transcriptional regulator with XRE-family HTH domain
VQKSPQVTIYNPGLLLVALLQKLELSNDRALAMLIGVSPSVISKIRTRTTPVSAAMLIRVNEITDAGISDIRAIIGERRTRRYSQDYFLNRGRRAGN